MYLDRPGLPARLTVALRSPCQETMRKPLVADFADKSKTLLGHEDLRLRMDGSLWTMARVECELCWGRTKVHLRRACDTLL